jgi:hypothetical protein
MRVTPNIGLNVWNDVNDEFNPHELEENWDLLDSALAGASTAGFIQKGATLPAGLGSGDEGLVFYLTSADGGFPSKSVVRWDGSTWAVIGPGEILASVPVTGNYNGRTVFLTSASGGFAANTLISYQSSGSSWSRVGGVEILASVPVSNNYAGRTVILTTASGGFDAYSFIVFNGLAYVRAERRGVENGTTLPSAPYVGQVFALTGATGNFQNGDIVKYTGSTWNRVSPPVQIDLATFNSITSPPHGMRVLILVDPTNGVNWEFTYNAGSASSYKWEFVGGPPMEKGFDTLTETPGTSYANFSTDLALTIPRSGDYRVEARIRNADTSNGASNIIDLQIAGALIGRPYSYQSGNTASQYTNGVWLRPGTRTGLTTGDVVRLQRKNSIGGVSMPWQDGTVRLLPVRIA